MTNKIPRATGYEWAQALQQRDATIAALQQQVATLMEERDAALFGERQANGLRMAEIGVSAGLRTERDAALAQVAVLTGELEDALFAATLQEER